MKAVVITKPGPPSVLAWEDRPAPARGRGQLLIEVRAAGLNRADIMQRLGHYPPPPGTTEDIPGLEAAGMVLEADPESPFRPGDRVMALLPGAAYATVAVAAEDLAIPVPQDWSWEEAAAVPEVYLTAFDALVSRLAILPGEWLLIHSVGSGVGIAALQLAQVLGARTIGTSRQSWKLERAHALALDHGVLLKDDGSWKEEVRRLVPEGVDAVLDLVGAGHWPASLEILRSRGRIVIVGLVSGSRTELDLGLLLQRRIRVEGTALRSRPDWEKAALVQEFRQTAWRSMLARQVRPVIDRVFPAEEASAAHRYLEENRSFGKVVLRFPPD